MSRYGGDAWGDDGHRVEIKSLDDAIAMLKLCAERMDEYDDAWRLFDRMAEVDVVRKFLETLKKEG